jgi:RimJ/RimL family protein N-acetyltransferase
MNVNVLRTDLLKRLPIRRGAIVVRRCERRDIDFLAQWPAYPEPYAGFTFSFAGFGPAGLDAVYRDRESQENRLTLVAGYRSAKGIGYLALQEIDWEGGWADNLGIRIHPEWCDQGVGSAMLAAVRDWWLGAGMKGLRLDVAASNQRAVRCYEKVGFQRSGELWKEARDLAGAGLASSKWRFLEGHVRVRSGVPEVRFLLMQLNPGEPLAGADNASGHIAGRKVGKCRAVSPAVHPHR